MTRILFILSFFIGLICGVALLRTETFAQNVPIYDRGSTGLDQAIKRLKTTASVMMIGAHPDDENSALLTYLARGTGARTVYLSLTRGDGGQNLIGPELFESLGVIRTEELIQARVLDGAEQLFARAYDYGFSKTLDEAKAKWPEQIVKCDIVRSIREYRPMVVVSVFSGTPADGHGHHQYSGYITPLAVAAAADPAQCKKDGLPWQVQKLYVGRGFSDEGPADLMIDTGEFDLSLGRSYFEIALEGRSKHSSQAQGRVEIKGEQMSGLNAVPKGKYAGETGIFDGLKITAAELPSVTGDESRGFVEAMRKCQLAIDAADSADRLRDRNALIGHLANASDAAREAIEATRDPHSKALAGSILKRANAALAIAAGIQIDALSNVETAVAGGTVAVSVKTFLPKSVKISVNDTELVVPSGFKVSRSTIPDQQSGVRGRTEIGNANEFFNVLIPADATVTEPYWLTKPRIGDLFDWPENDNAGSPFARPIMSANVTIGVEGKSITFELPVEFRFADPSRGELRRDFSIVPSVTLEPDSPLIVMPASGAKVKRSIGFAVRNNSDRTKIAAVGLNGERGRTELEFNEPATFGRRGERRTFVIDREFDGRPATHVLDIYASVDGRRFDREMVTITYPHIQTRRYYRAATTTVKFIDMKAERRRIGYVMGPGDDVPTAIEQIGFEIKLLDESDLISGDLDQFDTIVIGIRAYETRSDLVGANSRLFDYVRRGGNMVVQYQRNAAFFQSMLPLPATLGPRVADETAPVKILDVDHPFFTSPNKITDRDFEGWVQERNLSSLRTFDAGYTPLLASNDPGEPENNGGLVNAKLGKGNYTYCSYAFFRQLPAGVDGAYRLFANILSRPRSNN